MTGWDAERRDRDTDGRSDVGRDATDRAAGEHVPGETSTGERPGGGSDKDSASPGGAVSGEIGRTTGEPGEGDLAGNADLGSAEGDHVEDVARRVREADPTLEDPPG